MQRRQFIVSSFFALGLAAIAARLRAAGAMAAEVAHSLILPDAEWKKRLTPQQYDILRHEGTERPFTSALLNEHRAGVFICAGCGSPLFASSAKFDSGTGWPSFFDALPERLATKTDDKLIVSRVEYHCACCGGHHGHLFNDGPQPTGLRYCSNGAALKFVPKEG